jgi:hypothetical protein
MANRIIDSREPDFVIGPKDDPYMLRWWAIPRNRIFNMYIHKILHDDDDRALHDHPWPSLSFTCEGYLRENYKRELNNRYVLAFKDIRGDDWTYRSSKFAHRLIKMSVNPPITIFMTGPRLREWGFHCPNGWVNWRDFVKKDNHSSVGRGCGEV